MSFAGSVLAMITTLKNNARPRRKPFEMVKGYGKNYRYGHKKLTFKEVSDQDLRRIKVRIQRKALSAKRRNILIYTTLSVIILGSAVYTIYFDLDTYHELNNQQQATIAAARKARELEYIKCINEGYQWLEKKQYHNAKFMFYEAFKINPTTIETLLANARAYILDCKENSVQCKEASKQLEQLNLLFPNDDRVINLLELYHSNE